MKKYFQKVKTFKFFALSVLFTFTSFASIRLDFVRRLCEGYLPTNKLSIPEGAVHFMSVRSNFIMPGGISKAKFNSVLDRIQTIYSPVIRSKGGRLSISRKWSDGTVNAYAVQFGSTWEVGMYGGLARHPAIGEEGFALVACHEVGHHIGGAPKIGGDWPTNEGGADYFSTLKCFRYFYENQDNEAWAKNAQIDSLARRNCNLQWTKPADRSLCLRASVGSQQVALMLADAANESQGPHFNTPDLSQVTRTDDRHPEAQCRLDTLFQGALCKINKSLAQNDDDPSIGSCTQSSMGNRPKCWFALR